MQDDQKSIVCLKCSEDRAFKFILYDSGVIYCSTCNTLYYGDQFIIIAEDIQGYQNISNAIDEFLEKTEYVPMPKPEGHELIILSHKEISMLLDMACEHLIPSGTEDEINKVREERMLLRGIRYKLSNSLR